ncbi:MAG: DUF3887 domain-containing protein, partial [Candidatus Thermoplasmatota archaeon]|nr:DUF3887 domain-containing protein [Candidatus Thermoplasmatota archaeon]
MKKCLLLTIFIILILGMGFSGCIDEEENNEKQQEELNLEFEAIRIVENLSQDNYQDVYQKFNDEMKIALPPQDLQAAWENLIYKYGDYREIKSTRKTEEY